MPAVPTYFAKGVIKEYMLDGCCESEILWYLDEIMLGRFGKFCIIAEKR